MQLKLLLQAWGCLCLGVFLPHAATLCSNEATYRPFQGPIELQNNIYNHLLTLELPQGRV